MLSHSSIKTHFNIVSHLCQGLTSDLFCSGSLTKTLYIFLFSPEPYLHLPFLHLPLTSSPLGPNFFCSTLFSDLLSLSDMGAYLIYTLSESWNHMIINVLVVRERVPCWLYYLITLEYVVKMHYKIIMYVLLLMWGTEFHTCVKQ